MAPRDVIRAWHEQADADDLQYASELLETAKLLMIDKAVEHTGTAQAQEVLSRFMSNKS